jgi:hypothetical protein
MSSIPCLRTFGAEDNLNNKTTLCHSFGVNAVIYKKACKKLKHTGEDICFLTTVAKIFL